jgi:adenosylcobinamide-GDP ribazoletransferase
MRAALAFLTRIPMGLGLGACADESPGAAWFGVAGAAIGGLASLPILALGTFQPWAAAVLALAVAAIVSGALHLDGLADTADALATPDAHRADVARRDPRTGAAGVAAVVLIVLLDVVTLGSLGPPEWAAVVLVAALSASRGVLPLVAVVVGRRGAPGRSGLGRWFVSRVSVGAALFSAGSTAIPGVIGLVAFGWRGPLVAAVAGVIGGLAAAAVISRIRNGLDGDGYGAVAELATPIALLASAAVHR